jgi:hypothetical protein
MQQMDSVTVIIETDVKTLYKNRSDKTIWQAGTLKALRGNALQWQADIQVSTRGNMRRKTCTYAPLKVRFLPDTLENDSVAEAGVLKLVSVCEDEKEHEDYVMREALAYQLYNLLTPESFQIKICQLVVRNPGEFKNRLSSFAFFIESEKDLAARLHLRPYKPAIVSKRRLDSLSFDRTCVFQYMIANTDWGVTTRHNVKIMADTAGTQKVIPYDFDYAGLVNATYAVPAKGIPISSVRDRYYMGPCRSEAHFQYIFDIFKSNKQKILRECKTFAPLHTHVREEITDYIEQFYNTIEDPRSAARYITKQCKEDK